MSIRSAVALFYIILAAVVSVVSGPGAGALATEIAVMSVFEIDTGAPAWAEEVRIVWEIDDLPAYLTEDIADFTRSELVEPRAL